MRASIVFSATIFYFGFITSGVQCISLGLISLIEVVEEWGCYDTEIRLTCGHLDSKIAILKATFTPNCTQEECIKGDLRRLLRAYTQPKTINSGSAERDAAKKFLETLRKSHPNDKSTNLERDNDNEAQVEMMEPRADHLVSYNAKPTSSLRVSLERLIVKYLRQLSPNEDFDEVVKRSVRYRRESQSQSLSDDKRIELGARNITIDEIEMQDRADDEREERYRKIYETRAFCPEQKRKSSTLDRSDIDEALMKIPDGKHNIRRQVTSRCSGKNHCSFLFAADDPIAVLWDSGLVHLKYICMEDYRANHYCSERLTIGNEVTPKSRDIQPIKGEPIAEARIQARDQTFHSLKILKSSEDVEEVPGFSRNAANLETSGHNRPQQLKQKEQNPAQGIYSQDFKVLKILPSRLDDFSDFELQKRIFFRTEGVDVPNKLVPTELTITTTDQRSTENIPSPELPSPTVIYSNQQSSPAYSNSETNASSATFTDDKRNFSQYENITLIIREGEEYIVTYPKPRLLDNFTMNATGIILSPTPTSATANTTNITPTALEGTASTASYHMSTANITTETPPAEQHQRNRTSEADFPENVTKHFTYVEHELEAAPTIADLSMESSDNDYHSVEIVKPISDNAYDNLEESDEDGTYVISGRKYYSSVQKTYFGNPLQQGFTMTPGYPKFYIGDSECLWTIVAPIAQKIRLTILDVSLRSEPVCRDFVQIVDLDEGQVLFNSCTESTQPLEIISHSNQVEVIVKAKSKFAYPKRGVLIHYSALGCLTPPPPLNGHFIGRTEKIVTFQCEPEYVFPDTAVNRRQLVCSEEHSWDRILPDCVEKLAVAGSGVVSRLNIDSYKRPEVSRTPKMMDNGADMVYDIIIPTALIVGLFVVNVIAFLVIMKYRKRSRNTLDLEGKELEEL